MESANKPERRGVILFGHGARDPEWAGPMQRMRAHLLESDPGLAVELAFLEFMSPTLEQAVDTLAAAGATRLAVVGVSGAGWASEA